MIAVLSDTHATTDPSLTDAIRDALDRAAVTVHAGDFTTPAVLDAFEAATDRLVAVAGNRDSAGVRERLPEVATVDALDRRVLVVHGHDHGRTKLSLLARQEKADVVVVGHTHRPAMERIGSVAVLNPGSHADPRGNRPAYATIRQSGAGVVGQLRTPDGAAFETGDL
jgi:putative phosphoesterase